MYSRSTVGAIALLAAAANGAASLGMLLILRRLLATNPDLLGRIAQLAESRVQWLAAWIFWMTAALTLVWFFDGLAALCAQTAPLAARAALGLALIGIVPDLMAEAIAIGVLPDIAARYLTTPKMARLLDDFLTWNQAMVIFTGFLANGLYTAAGAILTWTSWRAGIITLNLARLGAGVWMFGTLLSLASLAGSAKGMAFTTGITMPLFCVWAGLTGQHLRKGSAAEARRN